jgi:hypothetical protein
VERQALAQATLLNDGGACDNLGIEPVWQAFRVILASDAGAPLRSYKHDLLDRLTWHFARSSELNDQLGRLARRRWFIGQIEEGVQQGAYWGINSAPVDLDRAFRWGYTPGFVRSRLAPMRTDLACFSEPEQFALENHGYAMSYAATHAWAYGALGLSPTPDPPMLPHTTAMDEARLDASLRHGHLLTRWQRWSARQLGLRGLNAH